MKVGITKLTHTQGWLYGSAIGIYIAVRIVGL
jgi:hypothetical protein